MLRAKTTTNPTLVKNVQQSINYSTDHHKIKICVVLLFKEKIPVNFPHLVIRWGCEMFLFCTYFLTKRLQRYKLEFGGLFGTT